MADYFDKKGKLSESRDIGKLLLNYCKEAEANEKQVPPNIDSIIKFISGKIQSNIDYISKSDTSDQENDFISFVLSLFPPLNEKRQVYYTHSSSQGESSSSSSSSDEDFSKNCKEPADPRKLKIGFEQIAGQESTKLDIQKTYIFPILYPNLFVTKSKGMLLYGPPGTGKTMLVKAAVKELGGTTAFFNPSPGEIKGEKHGQTEKNIDLLFKCAEKIIGQKSGKDESGKTISYTSSVIFIDEFDGIGGLKKDDPMMTLSVNSLLQRMDGILSDDSKNVSVIAATNYPWNIEEAILRRFTNKVFVDLPDFKARQYLLLQPLHKYFIPPGENKENLIDNGKINFNFLAYIEKFGKNHCEVSEDDAVDENFIIEIAKKLGADKNAKNIRNKIIQDRILQKIEDIDNITSLKFGYSGSDISKIMDIAIQKAAYRALYSGYFKKITYKSSGEYYYYSVPKKEYTDPDVYVLDNLDSSERDKLFNFSICKNDIRYGIEQYPSTINPKSYIELLQYRYLGVSPSK